MGYRPRHESLVLTQPKLFQVRLKSKRPQGPCRANHQVHSPTCTVWPSRQCADEQQYEQNDQNCRKHCIVSFPVSCLLIPSRKQGGSKVPCSRNGVENERDQDVFVFKTKCAACEWHRLPWPKLNAPLPNGSLMLGHQARRPFAMRRGIPIGHDRRRFSFHRHFPCLPLPTLCVPLHPPAHHVLHNSQ